jgi:hypothetical protein
MGLTSNDALRTAIAGQLPPLGDQGLSSETLDDLEMVRGKRTNLLVIGDHAATRAVLDKLRLSTREAALSWRPGQALDLPHPGRAGTLILHDVDQLTIAAQGALLRWLDQSAGRVWIVSTTTEPLWPQVESGSFSDTLYYRLNIICVRVPPAEADWD